MDLKVVQLITGAMQNADREVAASAAAQAPSTASMYGPAATYEPSDAQPAATSSPSPAATSAVNSAAQTRVVNHVIYKPTYLHTSSAPLSFSPIAPEPSHITPSPIQPPWKVLPWQCPPAPALMVKLVIQRPDNISSQWYKGSVMDCFI
jgi:hypothetical protein